MSVCKRCFIAASLFVLVQSNPALAAKTCATKKSGTWSDRAIWNQGCIPSNNDDVVITEGHTVLLDSKVDTVFNTVMVDGKLRFAPNANTLLRLDTMMVAGAVEMGTAAKPIAPNVTAKISIVPLGKLDSHQVRRGIMVMGRWTMHGANKAGYALLARRARAGEKKLKLKKAPANWRVGDSIVVAGTTPDGRGDDARIIRAIRGKVVTLNQPLSKTHAAPAGFSVHVINITRNAIVESAKTDKILNRGHFMSMVRETEIYFGGFYGLGRTDKKRKVGNDNRVGRYGVHLHRNGVRNDGNPSIIHGNAFVGSPGVGFTHHSSYAFVSDNVAYNNVGSSFFSEAGDEIGVWDNNVSIRNGGSGDGWYSRSADFGHSGHGFWLQSPGIHVINNVASGSADSGFGLMTRGLKEGEKGQRMFVTANIERESDKKAAKGAKTLDVERVPLFEVRKNLAYGNAVGFRMDLNLPKLVARNPGMNSTVDGLRMYNNDRGMMIHYCKHITVKNTTIVGGANMQYGLQVNGSSNYIRYQNLTVLKYPVAVREKYRSAYIPRINGDLVNGTGMVLQVRNGGPKK